MVRVWKTKSLLFCLTYDPLMVFWRQNHITFIFIKMMSHDLLVQMAYWPFFNPSSWTFREPNLIHWRKYKKSSASESLRNACFNLERFSRCFCLARPEILHMEGLWNVFDSETPSFSCTEPNAEIIIIYFVSTLTEMSIFRLLNLVQCQLWSASESIQPV